MKSSTSRDRYLANGYYFLAISSHSSTIRPLYRQENHHVSSAKASLTWKLHKLPISKQLKIAVTQVCLTKFQKEARFSRRKMNWSQSRKFRGWSIWRLRSPKCVVRWIKLAMALILHHVMQATSQQSSQVPSIDE